MPPEPIEASGDLCVTVGAVSVILSVVNHDVPTLQSDVDTKIALLHRDADRERKAETVA